MIASRTENTERKNPLAGGLRFALTVFAFLVMADGAYSARPSAEHPSAIPADSPDMPPSTRRSGTCANTPQARSTFSFDIEQLLDAMIQVESGGDGSAIGDGGKAIGILQIHKGYVDDVNRILGRRAYSYADRRDPVKSREMAKIYLTHYAKNKSAEAAARIHNGGPRGNRKPETVGYGKKVMKVYRQAGKKN